MSTGGKRFDIADDVSVTALVLRVSPLVGQGEVNAGLTTRQVSIESIPAGPNSSSLGTSGDLRVTPSGVWIKTSGVRTNTGWVQLGSGGGSFTFGGTVTSVSAGASSSVGTSTNAVRGDHAHGAPVAAPVTSTGVTNSAGTATTLSRADHRHRLELGVLLNGTHVGSRPRINLAGSVTVSDDASNDRVNILVSGPSPGSSVQALSAGASAATGSSVAYAREDHAHGVPVASAVAISSNANAAGASTRLSRADHTHQLTTAAPSNGQVPMWNGSAWVAQAPSTPAVPGPGGAATTIVAAATGAAGSSSTYSRQDHVHAVPVAAGVSVSSNTSASGTSASQSRSDHTHQLTTAAPSNGQVPAWNGSAWVASDTSGFGASPGGAAPAETVGASGAAGTSALYSRQDHAHAAQADSAVSISGNSSAAGSSTSFSRADHTHQLTTTTPSSGQVPAWNGSAWAPLSVSLPGAGGTPDALDAGQASAAGSSSSFARQDHVHQAATASGVSIQGNANASGSASTMSRSDHAHAMTATTPSNGQVPTWNGTAWVPSTLISLSPGASPTSLSAGSSAAAGTSTNYARQDHAHAVPVATAVSISGNANAAGASTSLARADHTHQLTTTTPTSGQVPVWSGSAWVATTVALTAGGAASGLAPDGAASAGTSSSYARQDHVHATPAATAVSISANTNAEGTSTSFARADHTHQLTTATPTTGHIPTWNGSVWVAQALSGGNTWNAVLNAGNESGAVDPVLSNGQSFRGVDGASPGAYIARGGNNSGSGAGAAATFQGGSGQGGGAAIFQGGWVPMSSNRAGEAVFRGGNLVTGTAAGGGSGGFALVHGGDARAAGASRNGNGGNLNIRGGAYRTSIGGSSSGPGGVYFRSGTQDNSVATQAGVTGPLRITTAAAVTVGDMPSVSGTNTSTGNIQIDTNDPGSLGNQSGDITFITGSVNATTGNNPGDCIITTGGMLRATDSAPAGNLTVALGLNAGQTSSPGGSGTLTAGTQTASGTHANSPGGSWTFIAGNSANSGSASSPAGSISITSGSNTNAGYGSPILLQAGTSSNNEQQGRVRTATDGVVTPKEDRTIEIQTSDASVIGRNIITLANAGSFMGIDLEVTAHSTGGANYYTRKISTAYFRTSTVLQETSPRHVDSQSSAGTGSSFSANLVVSGNNVVLNVQGAASTTVRWSIKMDYKARVTTTATSGTPVPRVTATNSVRIANIGNSYEQNYDSIPAQTVNYVTQRIGTNTIQMGTPAPITNTIANHASGYFTAMTLGGMALHPTINQVTNGGSQDAIDTLVAAGPNAYDYIMMISDFRRSQDINTGAGINWEVLSGAGGTNPNLYGTLLEVKRRVMTELRTRGINTPVIFRMTHEGYNSNTDSNLDDFTRMIRLQMLGARQLENEAIAGNHPNFAMILPDHYVWWRLQVGSSSPATTAPLGPFAGYSTLTHPQSQQAGNRNYSWLNRSQGVTGFDPNGHQNYIATLISAWIRAYVLFGIDPRQNHTTGALTGDIVVSQRSTTIANSNLMLRDPAGRIYGGHNTGVGNDPYNTTTNPSGPPDSALDLPWTVPSQILPIAEIVVAALTDYYARTTEFD